MLPDCRETERKARPNFRRFLRKKRDWEVGQKAGFNFIPKVGLSDLSLAFTANPDWLVI